MSETRGLLSMQDKDRELSKYRFSLEKETLANAKKCFDEEGIFIVLLLEYSL